jgi:hypothetical protein
VLVLKTRQKNRTSVKKGTSHDGLFVLKYVWKRNGLIKLKAGNPTFADIVPKEGQTLQFWGVVLTAINTFQAH